MEFSPKDIIQAITTLIALYLGFRFKKIDDSLKEQKEEFSNHSDEMKRDYEKKLSEFKVDAYQKFDQQREAHLSMWGEIHKVKDKMRDSEVHLAEDYIMKKDLHAWKEKK